jgi:hypothetical protein
VNRPFYAFGVLLALLALAMVAVSSTTRTRMVQSPQAHDKGTLKTPARRGSAVYIVVLPEAEQARAAATVAIKSPSPAVVREASFDACSVSQITPVTVSEVSSDAALAASSADCRSLYDPVYDELVYGEFPSDQFSRLQSSSPEASQSLVSCAEVSPELALFQSLAGPSMHFHRSTNLALDWLPSRRDLAQLQQWFAIQAEQLIWTLQLANRAAITWSEYAELMQDILNSRGTTAAPSNENTALGTVRSSGWLLHFAVSSLSRAGVALQQAAAHLQSAGDEFQDVGPVATRE